MERVARWRESGAAGPSQSASRLTTSGRLSHTDELSASSAHAFSAAAKSGSFSHSLEQPQQAQLDNSFTWPNVRLPSDSFAPRGSRARSLASH